VLRGLCRTNYHKPKFIAAELSCEKHIFIKLDFVGYFGLVLKAGHKPEVARLSRQL